MSDAEPTWLLPPSRILPQREDTRAHWFDQIETVVTGIGPVMMPQLLNQRLQKIVPKAAKFENAFRAAADRALSEQARGLRRSLRRDGLLQIEHVARSF